MLVASVFSSIKRQRYSASSPGSVRARLGDTHTDTDKREEGAQLIRTGDQGGWGGVGCTDGGQSRNQTLGVRGRPVALPWLGALTGPPMGLGPLLAEGQQEALCMAAPGGSLRATPAVCALKCQLCRLWSGAAVLSCAQKTETRALLLSVRGRAAAGEKRDEKRFGRRADTTAEQSMLGRRQEAGCNTVRG
uniref:Uncharacterized protein n=1 Tax=Pipistrellus kuhlii TaxID=59472 RepID=A0A7J8A8M4_PIPKU|nr:hypothetical protein mPipKuh1_009041 [Pipistrellus kuhlii]